MPFVVNYLAVVGAAVAAFVIGMVWYSPLLFGKAWSAAHGYTPEKVATMKAGGMGKAYAASLIGSLVTALVIGILVDRMDVLTALGGAKVGGLAWLGFAAPIGLSANLFSDKPFSLWLIDTGYQLVYLIAMGLILAKWG